MFLCFRHKRKGKFNIFCGIASARRSEPPTKYQPLLQFRLEPDQLHRPNLLVARYDGYAVEYVSHGMKCFHWHWGVDISVAALWLLVLLQF